MPETDNEQFSCENTRASAERFFRMLEMFALTAAVPYFIDASFEAERLLRPQAVVVFVIVYFLMALTLSAYLLACDKNTVRFLSEWNCLWLGYLLVSAVTIYFTWVPHLEFMKWLPE